MHVDHNYLPLAILCNVVYIFIIIIINEFHLKVNFRAAVCHVLH